LCKCLKRFIAAFGFVNEDVVAKMHTRKLAQHVYLIDVETGGIENFVASYVLKGEKVALVETGPTSSIPNLLAGLKELDVDFEDVLYVAVSHIHLDHGGGVGTLVKSLPNAKVIAHSRGVPHLIDPSKLWEQSQAVLGKDISSLYGAPEPIDSHRIIGGVDGMILNVGCKVRLQIVETTGHASHHESYLDLLSGGLFPGDAAGIYLSSADVIVPTTPAPFRLDIALASLDKLISLRPNVLYYSHFGLGQDAISKLHMYRNQLELWAEVAKKGLAAGEGVEAISARIAEADPAIRKALDYIRNHSVLGETVLNQSVQGVVDFVQKASVK
jgi:glyoxylase-like metal-dependent hydrolase (beta-lactamase superfamily II)